LARALGIDPADLMKSATRKWSSTPAAVRRADLELVGDAAVGWVLPVLDLEPSAGTKSKGRDPGAWRVSE
jgi:hypothetical protein